MPPPLNRHPGERTGHPGGDVHEDDGTLPIYGYLRVSIQASQPTAITAPLSLRADGQIA
ncbi:hypothetical protein OHS59_43980 [Streptomyces sp. NBC_00414]|uniref:hypothetical protein n=1 Tax=Streptomyces sp. NBC_00414 TaxID=2975739 RepID=UPI002E1A623A